MQSVPTYLRKEHAWIQFCAKKSCVVVTLLPTHNQDIAHYYPLKLHQGNSIFKDCKSPVTSSFAWQRLPPLFPLSLLDPLTLFLPLSIPLVLLCVVYLFLLPPPFLSLRTFILTHFFRPVTHSRPYNLCCTFTSCLWGHLLLPSTDLRSASAPSPFLMSNPHVQASNFSLPLVQESSSIFLICIWLTLTNYFFCFYNSLFWPNAPQTLYMQYCSGFTPELTIP